jgi:hypothetical protein
MTEYLAAIDDEGLTYDPLLYHAWREIDGPLGLLLDCTFCLFVILAGLGLMAFALLILLVDYVISPVRLVLLKP